MSKFKRAVSIACVLMLLPFAFIANALAADYTLDSAMQDTAEYIYGVVKAPQVGSVGGEWAVMALARSGFDVENEYFHKYYATLEAYVKACDGNLDDKKYTEYSRVILTLSAIGKDPRNVAGYDLLKPLGDFNKTVWQGLNGPIFALLALDTGNYAMPVNKDAAVCATRDMYVDYILERQLSDGGFNLTSIGAADPDITGMVLQALSKYQSRADVKEATEKALKCMSEKQLSDGGFSSWGTVNSESTAQIIIALTELKIPLDDPRFVKNGNTALDNLMTFYRPGKGFVHTTAGGGSDQMAAEQAFCALIAARRARDGKPSFYRMSTDSLDIGVSSYTGPKPGEGLENKHADVKPMPVVSPGVTFDDISGERYHANTPAVEALAARGIIDGKSDNIFAPDDTMARAEFAAIIVRGLGLSEKENGVFKDVPSGSWFAGYVGTAYTYGIVNGRSEIEFDPYSTITREEAATMIARAMKLCGMETDMDNGAIRDILSQFFDYVTVSAWAQESMAVCYSYDILSQQDDEISPKTPILRGEIAQMLFNMLGASNLL